MQVRKKYKLSSLFFEFIFRFYLSSEPNVLCNEKIITSGLERFMCHEGQGQIGLLAYGKSGNTYIDTFIFPTSCTCLLMEPSSAQDKNRPVQL